MIGGFYRQPQFRYTIKLDRTLETNIYVLFWIMKRLRGGYSPIIGVCGDQRDGKSWFAMYFVYMILKMFKKHFEAEKHMIYSPNDIDQRLEGMTEEVILFDEAAYSYYKRLWYKSPNTSLSKIIFVQGRRTRAYIFISPFINDIDKAFTKHFDIIIDVQRRGIAKTYKMKKKHMAFSDRENFPIWSGDVSLNTRKIEQGFKDVLEVYKKESERMKDQLENEYKDDEQAQALTVKQMLRRI